MSPNSLPSLTTYTKTPAQSHPTLEIGTNAGLMVIPMEIPFETAKNLEPGMTRAQQKLIQKGGSARNKPI